MGLTFLPKRLIQQGLADARLELVLPGLATRGQLFAVYSSRKNLSA
jgi:hypothetical protein